MTQMSLKVPKRCLISPTKCLRFQLKVPQKSPKCRIYFAIEISIESQIFNSKETFSKKFQFGYTPILAQWRLALGPRSGPLREFKFKYQKMNMFESVRYSKNDLKLFDLRTFHLEVRFLHSEFHCYVA